MRHGRGPELQSVQGLKGYSSPNHLSSTDWMTGQLDNRVENRPGLIYARLRGRGTIVSESLSSDLGPFLQELEQCLQSYTLDELREVLLSHARGLPPEERLSFLSIFRPAARSTPRVPSCDQGMIPAEMASSEQVGLPEDTCEQVVSSSQTDLEPQDYELIAELDAFVGRLTAGDYCIGWDWDPDTNDHRLFGDESWVDEMDGFFDEAGSAFLAGDYYLAKELYRRTAAVAHSYGNKIAT